MDSRFLLCSQKAVGGTQSCDKNYLQSTLGGAVVRTCQKRLLDFLSCRFCLQLFCKPDSKLFPLTKHEAENKEEGHNKRQWTYSLTRRAQLTQEEGASDVPELVPSGGHTCNVLYDRTPWPPLSSFLGLPSYYILSDFILFL